MPGFIRDKADEATWERAKDAAAAAARKGGIRNPWGLANHIYQKMKGLKEEQSVTPDETKGLINNLLEDECWKDIKHYVFNHPVYSQLSEEDRYYAVEEAFKSYLEKNNDLTPEKLFEFVNQYMHGGSISGSMAGGGVGGWRDEKPNGPIVYGMPDNEMKPMGGQNGDPAIVVIPEPKSNYKPWETELDADGDVVSDIERNKVMAQDKENSASWDGPLGEIARYLEDEGVNLEDLDDMTQEEIEDLLIRIIKKDGANSQDAEVKQAVANLKETKWKIQEAFVWELEEDRVGGKIRKAREILANKHQVKKATERDEHRRYTLDKTSVQRLMTKYGYVFSWEKSEWVKKVKKVKKKTADDSSAPVVSEPEKQNSEVSAEETPEDAVQKPDVQPKAPESQEDDEEQEVDENPLHDSSIRSQMKVLQARFILGIAHDDKVATSFVKNEEDKMVAEIPDDQVLAKFELLGYIWNPDTLIWNGPNVALPDAVFAKGEGQKSIFARSFLAAIERYSSIKVNEQGTASVDAETVIQQMQSEGFVFNTETNTWTWVEPKEDEEIEKIEESLKHEATPGLVPEDEVEEEENEELNEQDDEQEEIQLGYDPKEAKEYQARFLLRAMQLFAFKAYAASNQGSPDLEKKWANISDAKNPVAFASQNKAGNPRMDYGTVIRELKKRGFKIVRKGGELWVDNGGTFPKQLDRLGENEKTVQARAILAVVTKDPSYIRFDDSAAKKGKTFEPAFPVDEVESEIQSQGVNFVWDSQYGWIESDKKDPEKKKLSDDQRIYERKRAQFMQQYGEANWDHMSREQKNMFKEYSAYELMLKEFGMKPKDFPSNDSGARASLLNKFAQTHKFTVDPKNRSAKGWLRREHPVMRSLDKVGLKAAVGSVARRVGQAAKGLTKAGGMMATFLKLLDAETGRIGGGGVGSIKTNKPKPTE